jgi:hypothetical protein
MSALPRTTDAQLSIRSGSLATQPSRAKIHRCRLLPESDQITDLAALPYTLTHSESWSRFRVWWLAWAAVERQDRQRASLSHGGAN